MTCTPRYCLLQSTRRRLGAEKNRLKDLPGMVIIPWRYNRWSLSSIRVARGMRRWRSMKAEEFDQAFDRGEDVSSALDVAAARRPGVEQRRVNVDFPVWMIESLDREARRLGVTRQSIIKVWIAERLEHGGPAAA